MESILTTQSGLLLLAFIVFAVVGILATFLTIGIVKYNQKNFKSPLNVKLLRQPGETIQNKISDLTLDIFSYLTLCPVFALMGCISISSNVSSLSPWIASSVLVVFLLSMVIVIKKAISKSIQRNKLRVGLEAERAVGDGITRLINNTNSFGFHDFQADGFNIDHIVISDVGIFAFETKGRSKKTMLENNFRVTFKDNKLKFPDKIETKPLKQSEKQAQWLSDFLSQKLQEKIPVQAVLAIPGWYIEFKQRSTSVIVVNGKNMGFLLEKKPRIYDNNQVKAIAGIIEERCLQHDALSYKESDKSFI